MAKHEAPQTPKKRGTKAAIAASFAALLLCGATLVGTTFAWFTDTATTGNNTIKAGELDVQLLQWNGESTETYTEIAKDGVIFGSATSDKAQDNNEDTLWEPGKTQIAYLAIKNDGNLWLDYDVVLNTVNKGTIEGAEVIGKDNDGLSNVMKYQFIGEVKNGKKADGTELNREELVWNTADAKPVDEGVSTVSDEKTKGTDAYYTYLAPGATHYFALAIHMDEQAGNDYQNEQVEFKLAVNATQYAQEEDSFGSDYDAGAPKIEMAGTAQELITALTQAKSGDIVALAGDVKLDENITITEDIVIEGNGNAITGKAIYLDGANVTFKNVDMSKTTRDDRKASQVYVEGTTENVVFDGCTFDDTQWDSIQATYNSLKNLTITNCTFDCGDIETVKSDNKIERYIHVEIVNPDTTYPVVNMTITNNTFKNCDKLSNDIVGIYYVGAGSTITIGQNTFDGLDNGVKESDKLWVGYPTSMRINELKEISKWTGDIATYTVPAQS